jgi:hypothetical protein
VLFGRHLHLPLKGAGNCSQQLGFWVGDVTADDDDASEEDTPSRAAHLSTDPRLAAAWDASLTPEQRTILYERLAWQQVRCRALPVPMWCCLLVVFPLMAASVHKVWLPSG